MAWALTILLLLLNAALMVLFIAKSPQGPVQPRRRGMSEQDVPPEDLLEVLGDAVSASDSVAITALTTVAADPVRYLPALPVAIGVLRESSSPVRLAAARAVRAILGSRPELLTMCWPEPGPRARLAILASVNHRTNRASHAQAPPLGREVDLVEQGMQDSDAAVRAEACARLQMLEPSRAVNLAAAALNDSDQEVRRIACQVLGGLGDARMIELLLEALATSHESDASTLLRTAADLGRRYPDALTRFATGGRTPGLRAAGIQALGATGLMSAAPVLVTMLDDPSKDIRRLATAAIADLARVAHAERLPAGTVDRLILQLERERSSSVLFALLDAMEVCGARTALDTVLRKLPEMNAAVRERAIEFMSTVEHG